MDDQATDLAIGSAIITTRSLGGREPAGNGLLQELRLLADALRRNEELAHRVIDCIGRSVAEKDFGASAPMHDCSVFRNEHHRIG